MQDVSSLVARLYTGHPYPPPVLDITASIAEGNYQAGDPSQWAPMLWPEGRPHDKLDILVAGCGTQQAAWIAYTNRDSEVYGVDLSEASLAHERYLQDKHDLGNLHLFNGDLRDVGALGRTFDVVMCAGVLHHMVDPDEGMRALAGVLASQGVFAGMVYAAPHRTGVYMMQDVFRRLGVQPDAEGIAFARRTLASLPQHHFVHHYGGAAIELRQDAALVDTFLHPQDRAYTVPEVLALVEQNGLRFQGWFENSIYHPEGAQWLTLELRERIGALPAREQWAAMEMLNIANFAHYFFARSGAAPQIAFTEPHWRELTPHPRPWVRRLAPGEYQRVGFKFKLPPGEAALFDRIDGRRSIVELMRDAEPGIDTRALFERLWKQGHVMLSKRDAYASSSTSQ